MKYGFDYFYTRAKLASEERWTELKKFQRDLLLDRELGKVAKVERKSLDEARALHDHKYKDLIKPLVSITIPTYNRGKLLLERTLPSVFSQTYDNFEIVIVGDCCTDDTEERLSRLGDPRIRFSNLPERVKYPEDPLLRWMVCGYAAAKRTLELAKGEWLAYMDDDDIWTPDHLEALLDFAKAGDYELVYGKYRCEVSPGLWREMGGPRFPGGRRPYRLTGVPHLTVMIRSYLASLKTYPLDHHLDVARYRLPLDNFTWQLMGRVGVRAGFLNQIVGIQALRPGETMLTPTAINTARLEKKRRRG